MGSTKGTLMTSESPNGQIANRRVLVTNTAQQILTGLTSRAVLRVMNMGSEDVYLGSADTVASGDGWPVYAGAYQNFNFGPDISPYIVSNGAGPVDCRVMEVE